MCCMEAVDIDSLKDAETPPGSVWLRFGAEQVVIVYQIHY